MPEALTPQVIGFFILFARLAAMTMLLPGVGDDSVSPRIRLMFAVLLTIILYPVLAFRLPETPTTVLGMAGVLIGEILVGLLLGGAVRIILSALHLAGTIIGMQSGLAAAMVFDPTSGGQAIILSRFLGLIGILVVFASNTHHLLIAGMAKSYALFPIGGDIVSGDFAKFATMMVGNSFLLGVQLSAPFLVFGVVFNLGLGLMSRLAPTLQVFFIAQPLSILLALALLMATLSAMMTWYSAQFVAFLRPILGS
jgi:flagellar biosynthesis protein FliR